MWDYPIHPQHLLPCLQSGIWVLSRKMSHEWQFSVAACGLSSTILQLFCSQWFLSPHCCCLLFAFNTSFKSSSLSKPPEQFPSWEHHREGKGWKAGWHLRAAGHTSCFGPVESVKNCRQSCLAWFWLAYKQEQSMSQCGLWSACPVHGEIAQEENEFRWMCCV